MGEACRAPVDEADPESNARADGGVADSRVMDERHRSYCWESRC